MNNIDFFSMSLTVFGMSMVPLVELKGAILAGIGLGLEPLYVWILSIIGSAIPSIFILLFSRPLMKWMRGTKTFKRLVHWVEGKVHRQIHKVSAKKNSLLALFIFVAIPLPGTGVWTGSLIASFLDIRIKHAFPAIFFGNVVAGVLVAALGIVAF